MPLSQGARFAGVLPVRPQAQGQDGTCNSAVSQQDPVLDTALTETNNTGQGFKDLAMNFLRREISDAFHWLLIINTLLPVQLTGGCWLCCCCWAVCSCTGSCG